MAVKDWGRLESDERPMGVVPLHAILSHHLLPPLLLSLTLGACAPSILELRAALEEAPLCCEDPRGLRYERLTPGESLVRDIGPPGAVYVFESGRSYYAAFALPEFGGPFSVSVRSYLSGGATYAGSYLFYPVVARLDGEHRVRGVHRVTRDEVGQRIAEDFPHGPYLPLEVPVSGEDRFLVLYTDATLLGSGFRLVRETTHTQTVYHPYGSTLVTHPVRVDVTIPYALAGGWR